MFLVLLRVCEMVVIDMLVIWVMFLMVVGVVFILCLEVGVVGGDDFSIEVCVGFGCVC